VSFCRGVMPALIAEAAAHFGEGCNGMGKTGGGSCGITPPLPRCVMEDENRRIFVLQYTSCLHREIAVQYGFKFFWQFYFPLLAGLKCVKSCLL
jgi:hypothetical protein